MATDRRLAGELFDAAIAMRVLTYALQAVTLFSLVGLLFFDWSSAATALATMAALVGSTVSSYFAEEWQRLGNELTDLLDVSDAFREPLPAEPSRTLMARIPALLEQRAQSRQSTQSYFKTQTPPGARRALEMYAESSWWSSEMSRRHEQLYGVITVALLLTLVAVTSVALVVIDDKTARTRLAEIVASVVTLLVSLGFGHLTLRYRSFSRTSEGICKAATRLVDKHRVSRGDALSLMHQYQLARAAAPPLHAWLWRLSRARLNRLWDEADDKRDLS